MGLAVALLGAACGTPTSLVTDASPGGDGTGSMDGANDAAPPDTASMFVPDPPDPVSLPCAGRLGFPNHASPPTRNQLTVVADLDNDGVLDLAALGFGTLDILLGNGDGTFRPSTSQPVPTNLRAFRFADLDGDGHRDLVFARQNTLLVELADGNGGFGPEQVLDATLPMNRVEVADLDGDGDLDLIGLSSMAVVVFLATPTGFGAAEPYSLGNGSAREFAVGDLTGDARPDVVATHEQDKVVVLANLGDGTLAPAVSFPVKRNPWGIALGDLDEDGELDVVMGTDDGMHAKISVLRNTGGTLSAAVRFEATSSLSESPRELGIADFDQDGHIDVVAVNTGVREADILRGTGSGALMAPLAVNAGRAPASVQIGDLDGNGRPDLVISDPSIATYLNNGSPALFEGPVRHRFSTLMRIAGARVVDLDDDGNLDLVALGIDPLISSLVATRLAIAPGAFAPDGAPYLSSTTTTATTTKIVLADMDNDGRRDVVLGDLQGMVFLNGGDGTLGGAAPYTASASGSVRSIATGDLDGDGFRDLVIALDLGDSSGSAVYLRGLGNGTFSTPEPIWSTQGIAGAAMVDLDGDGRLDVVIDDFVTTARRLVMRGLGGGMLAPPLVTSLPILGNAPLARDLDDDGHPDLISFSETAFIVTRGAGDGTLAAPVMAPTRAGGVIPAFADLDGDGDLDVVTGDGSLVGVMLGRGDGTFSEVQMFDAGANLRTISTADVDADGRVDIVVDNDFQDVTVLSGRCL